MDLVFAVNRNGHTNFFSQVGNTLNSRSLCSISSSNIIAFTTKTEINDLTNKSWGFHIYVADINNPWHCFKVTSNKYPISILEWDPLGKYLLIGDISGCMQIWIQKDNLLSEWLHLYNVKFPAENIIKATFFYNGRTIVLSADKRDSIQFMEKFQKCKMMPSVRQYGGVPADGVLIITSTGMLGTFLIPTELPNISGISQQHQQQQQVQQQQLPIHLYAVTESLGRTRSFITSADITYGKFGQFLIAVANEECDNSSTMIQCYRVTVKKHRDKLTINSQSLRSFFLKEGGGRDIIDLKITHLKWVSNDELDSLLVGAKCSSGSFLELWSLVEHVQNIHQLFQLPNKPDVVKTMVWANQLNYTYSSQIIGICVSKFQYYGSCYIFVTMADNTIHCLHRDSMKRVLPILTNLNNGRRNENEHSSKQIRLESNIVAHDISTMGHLLTVIDLHGQLLTYRVTYPHQEQTSIPQTIVYISTLLEYCLVSGYDSLDVFLLIKIQLLDNIIERLTDIFTRQSQPIQQYYYVNFLTMKTNLYRLSLSGQSKSYDLTSFLMLHSILTTFKSLLRPSDLTSHDKGPAENLAKVLIEPIPDIDKALFGLEPKDFTVEPSTLQSLQQLIQWVADLALNILAKLPENRSLCPSSRNLGYEISKDVVALNSIRELLVMMRIWGLLKPQCLPVFARSADNLDILATLFRMLTKLALNPNEPEDGLLDECCLLPNQVFIPQLHYIPPRTAIVSPMLTYVSLPIQLEYNVEPNNLKYCPDIPAVDGGSANSNIVDSVRHLQLGKRPLSLRRCTRCNACSSIWSVAKTAAMRAWEQRWLNGCKCGGFWRLQLIE